MDEIRNFTLRRRWSVTQSAMWSDMVVMLDPLIDNDSSLPETVEELPIQ